MRVGTRRPLRAVAGSLLLVGVAAIVVMMPQGTAWADCPPDPVNPMTGLCATVTVTIPADPPPDGPADPTPSAAVTCPGAPGGECRHGNAWWSSAGQCYATAIDSPPAPGTEAWQAIAGDATDGTLMVCDNGGEVFYVPDGENLIPDARTIALNAVKRVPFVTAEVHTAPAPPDYTYVHLENWLWVPEGQWRTVEARAAVGGTAVTVTAEPSKIEWAMGDGYTKVCRNAGRAWVRGMTDAAKTSCGYAYDTISVRTKSGSYDPDGRFGVTAQFFYEVRWSCTGVCSASGGALGEYPGPLSPVSELEVRQRQTVVTQ